MADAQTELNVLENKLQAQLESANRVRNTNILIGVVLIVVITGYFHYMKSKLVEFSEPKAMSEVASGWVLKDIDKVSDYIDKQARTQVPTLIDSAITHIVTERIPQARVRLEGEVKTKLDNAVVESQRAIIDRFETTLKDHGKDLPELVKNLQTAEGKEAFEEDIFKMLEDAIKDDEVAAQVDSYGATLQDVDRMLKEYSDPKSEKTDDEKLVCEMIALMKEISHRTMASSEHSTLKHMNMGLGGTDTGSAGAGDSVEPVPAKKEEAPKSAAK